jgi:hypothetical protein
MGTAHARRVIMKSTRKRAIDKAEKRRLAREAEGGASVAVVGALVGVAAGPPGMIVGAILGGVAGALAGVVLDDDASRRASRTRELDEEIGVGGGDLGVPSLTHPPAKIGAYSMASAGVSSSSGSEPAEGPMQTPEE